MMMMSAMRFLICCRLDHRTAALVRQRPHDSPGARMDEKRLYLLQEQYFSYTGFSPRLKRTSTR
jgi:hypothetical protein